MGVTSGDLHDNETGAVEPGVDYSSLPLRVLICLVTHFPGPFLSPY